MGDWSEAMNDGVICRGCAMPLGSASQGGLCSACASNGGGDARDRLGPGWLPDNGEDRTR